MSVRPTWTRLAAQGVVFENAYCNFPLCAPSRASLMSGQLASRIGVYDNAAEFPASVPTLAHDLRALGYATCLAGKMHFVGPDQLHGFEERLTTDIYPADFGWTPNWDAPEERIDWWYHNMASVRQAGIAEATNQLDFDEEVAFQAERQAGGPCAAQGRTAILPVRFLHPSARPLRRAARLSGTATVRTRSIRPRSRRCRPTPWTRTACG